MTEIIEGYALSRQQRRLWRARAAGWPVGSRVTVELRGAVDQERLRAAVAAAVRRHEALRTTFRDVPGLAEPLQVVAPAESLAWGPDAAAGPVVAADLRTEEADRWLLRLETSALNADAASLTQLVTEIADRYADPSAPEDDEPVQYAQYSEWQRESGADPEAGAVRSLRPGQPAETAPLPFERDLPAAPDQVVRYAERHLLLPGETVTALRELAGSGRADHGAVLSACWLALLARLGDRPAVTLDRSTDGRAFPELAGAVGPFAHRSPVTVPVRPDASVADLVAEWEKALAGAGEHHAGPADTPVPGVAGGAALPAGCELAPARATAHADGVEFTVREIDCDGEPAHLVLVGDPDRPELLRLRYLPLRFTEAAADTLLDQLAAVLEYAAAHPDRPLWGADLFTARTAALLDQCNDTDRPGPLGDLVELVEAQAARTPTRPAASDHTRTVTYADLDRRANQVAHLLAARGVGAESLVACCLEPSCEALAVLLGVLKSGAAWLPLDPRWPASRHEGILATARPAVLVTEERLAVPRPDALPVVLLDHDAAGRDAAPAAPAGYRPHPENLAYVMYTSGSTGEPKGVSVTRRGLANYLTWCRDAYRMSPETVGTVHSSMAFDLTVTSMLAPLTVGGRVRFTATPTLEGLVRELAGAEGTTLLKITPAHLQLLAGSGDLARLADVRALVVGGEALTEEALAPWRRLTPEAVRVNEYGPTETVVGCCVHVDSGPTGRAAVPIGRPIDNTRIYVLDADGRRTPVGVVGEIYIGGAGVARGYHRRPALTAERFVPDPFGAPDGRLYRTGDLGRHLADGGIEFLGRNDDQVQIHGFRVEPGEVEAELVRHPDVAACAVAARGTGAGRVLAGYVTPAPGARPDPAALRGYLRDRLPAHLVPSSVRVLAELPLTANGKVDRDCLPEPPAGDGAPAAAGTAPDGHQPSGNPREQAIAEIWASVLGVKRVGVHDRFFDLGGHSFLLIELAARLQAAVHPDISVVMLFEYPTVASFTAALDRAGWFTADYGEAAGETAAEEPEEQDEARERARRRRAALGARRPRHEGEG